MNDTALARKYGLSVSGMHAIISRKSWAWLK